MGAMDAVEVVNEPKAPPKEILNKAQDAKAVIIKKAEEIADKIVVKEQQKNESTDSEENKSEDNTTPQVTVQVEPEKVVEPKIIEKEIIKNIIEVPKDYRKIVCFVGAPKVGTTFCVNAVGTYLAKSKVKTSIVDVTRKRDSPWVSSSLSASVFSVKSGTIISFPKRRPTCSIHAQTTCGTS